MLGSERTQPDREHRGRLERKSHRPLSWPSARRSCNSRNALPLVATMKAWPPTDSTMVPIASLTYPAHRCVRISAQQGSQIQAASVQDEGEHSIPLNRHTKKMAFTPHMPTAARRHLEAAEILFGHGTRLDVSGYLYGIAAECAVKALMLDAGMRPLGDNLARREDPFYAHFPEILTMLRDAQFGRQGVTLRKFIENRSFMHHWDTQMRYCRGSEIDKHWVNDWRAQAKQLVASIGT